jgi:hypothetical protein
MNKMCKVVTVGYCYKSKQNGKVCDPNGINPAVCCGAHMGCEPKIIEIVYEQDDRIPIPPVS